MIRRTVAVAVLAAAVAMTAAPCAGAFAGSDGVFAYEHYDGRSVEFYTLDYGYAGKLTRPGIVFTHPRWSADGRRLLMTGAGADGRQLWVAEVQSPDADHPETVPVTSVHRLTEPGAGDNSDGAWSPDGRQIAYVHTPPGGVPEVWRMRADGGDRRQLAWSPRGSADPDWSPDGRELAFTSWPVNAAGGLPRIFAMDAADGTGKRKITASPGRRPAWSPDGTELLFEAVAPTSSIDVVRRDGRRLRTLRSTDGPSPQLLWPRWSPDGSGLVYVNDNSGSVPHDPSSFSAPVLMSLAGDFLPGLIFVYGGDTDWGTLPHA